MGKVNSRRWSLLCPKNVIYAKRASEDNTRTTPLLHFSELPGLSSAGSWSGRLCISLGLKLMSLMRFIWADSIIRSCEERRSSFGLCIPSGSEKCKAPIPRLSRIYLQENNLFEVFLGRWLRRLHARIDDKRKTVRIQMSSRWIFTRHFVVCWAFQIGLWNLIAKQAAAEFIWEGSGSNDRGSKCSAVFLQQ
jgi:hypothetical protein